MKRILIMIACSLVSIMTIAHTQGDTLMVKQAREAVKAKDYSKGLDIFLEADKTFVVDTTDYYGNLQHNIGYCYYMMGDKRNAAVYWEKALKVFPQFFDKNGQMLEFLAGIYDELGDDTNLMRILELTEAHNKHELTKPMTTIKDYLDRAQYYDVTDEKSKAKDIYLQAVEKVKDGTAEEKEDVYSAYAKYLSGDRDWQGAAEYYSLAAEARKETKGEDRQWALTMYWAALNIQLQQNWSSAYETYEKASKAFENCGDDKYVRNCLSGMGTCMYFQQQYDEAKAFYVKVMKSLEADNQSADYAKALRNVAKADVKLNQFDEALSYLQTATEIYEKLGDSRSLQSTQVELNRVKVKAGQGFDEGVDQRIGLAAREQSQKILDEERKNLPLYKLMFGEDGVDYVRSLGLVAELTYELEDKAKGIDLYEDYLDKYRTALRKSFAMQDEKERQRTWNEETMTLDSLMAHACDDNSNTTNYASRLNAMAYDVQLLSKGVLLNSSIEFSQVVEESGDATLKANYAKAKDLQSQIAALQADNGSGSNTVEIARLKGEYDRLMLTLMQTCKELDDYTKYLDYTWKDVQKALDDNDVAIEFAEIKNGILSGDNQIVAIVNAKSLATPQIVPICMRKKAAMMVTDSLKYDNAEYGKIVWGNLWQYVNGCKHVYFSPSAELASLGIEYLSYQGKPMIDHVELFRLSSTKELCRQHEQIDLRNVALFGGIDYGAEGQGKSVTWQHTDERTGIISEEQSGVINYAPLAGTEKEVNGISVLLKKGKGYKPELFTGTNASEQSLRGLSGNKELGVLHIATHGAFIGNRKTTEAEAMQCSLLAFSGINETTEDENNDGQVTAQDIADMNLRSCGMAVLSACETGLGKLGSDGVFGLQRGFKNAGVHTLLMSLNRVNDAATTELMTQFYKALMDNPAITPNAALRKAQQVLRNGAYNTSKYWASFIILDGQ